MNRTRILIIIGIVVAVLGAAAALFIVLGPKAGEEAEVQVDKPHELAYYIPGDYFVTNVIHSKKLLKTSVSLGFDKKTIDLELLKEQQAVIRDIINRELRMLSEENIADPNILDSLRDRLLTRIRNDMGLDNLFDIKFMDFVAQG